MKLVVSSKKLQRALKVAKALKAVSICMTYSDGKLYFTVNRGIVYQKSIDCISAVDTVSLSSVVSYLDISEFLPDDGEVTLEFIDTSIVCQSEECRVTFKQSEALLSKTDNPSLEGAVPFDSANFNKVVATIVHLSPLERMYKRSALINFMSTYASVQYPTFWVRVASPDLKCTLTMDEAKLLRTFVPKSYRIEKDVMYLFTTDEFLVLPCTTALDESAFMDILQDMGSIAFLDATGVYSKLERAQRIFGSGEVTVYAKEKGVLIRITRKDIDTEVIIGDVTQGETLCTFHILIEFLTLAFNLLGEGTFEILYKGGTLCLRNKTISMLISAQ